MAAGSASRQSFVILSGYHDYRSKRKADLHFIADELKQCGAVSFISLRYSYLTRYKEDPRHDLWNCANTLQTVDGVGCYLWRTPVHPFHLPKRFSLLERAVFAGFARHLPSPVRAIIAGATIVMIESGISIIYIPLIKRINPKARIIYLASDSLDAIGQAGAIKDALIANAAFIDAARVPSPLLADDVPPGIPCYFIPHGIDKTQFASIGPSPFAPKTRNAVSVGSMLFDSGFFEIAGPMFPDVTFHVIGSGYPGPGPDNVRYYPEMPFAETLPYLKHSDFAVAAYGPGVAPYLTHTSMKLMQYDFLAIPAICPQVVAGSGGSRYGYDIKKPLTIRAAIEKALANRVVVAQPQLDWRQVTRLILDADGKHPAIGAEDAVHAEAGLPRVGTVVR